MSQDHAVYDLGEVDHAAPAPVSATAVASNPGLPVEDVVGSAAAEVRRAAVAPASPTRVTRQPARPRPSRVARGWQPGPGLTGSLSVIFPGTGQIVAGEAGIGLFLIAAAGFVAAVGWAVLATFDRMIPTLELLEMPASWPMWSLVGLFACAAAIHVFGAVHAQGLGVHYEPARTPHPVVSGIASAILPGWGQLLNGHRVRAALLLAGVWLLAAMALLVSAPVHPAIQELTATAAATVPLKLGRGILITVAAVGWSLAVYDGVAGAMSRRRQRAGIHGDI
jgi:hypothetical protein